jgi:hypothetical protein
MGDGEHPASDNVDEGHVGEIDKDGAGSPGDRLGQSVGQYGSGGYMRFTPQGDHGTAVFYTNYIG